MKGTGVKMKIGNIIEQRRKDIGFSRKKVASEVGISVMQLWRWENDKSEPSFSNFFKLCDVLRLNINFIGKELE